MYLSRYWPPQEKMCLIELPSISVTVGAGPIGPDPSVVNMNSVINMVPGRWHFYMISYSNIELHATEIWLCLSAHPNLSSRQLTQQSLQVTFWYNTGVILSHITTVLYWYYTVFSFPGLHQCSGTQGMPSVHNQLPLLIICPSHHFLEQPTSVHLWTSGCSQQVSTAGLTFSFQTPPYHGLRVRMT
jgi:hypothetical protein